MAYANALFELLVALAAFGFFAANAGMFPRPDTHPQWRAAIALSLFVGVTALTFFIRSVRNLRRP